MPSSGFQTCARSEEHTSELQSHSHLVCRLLLEKKKHLPAPGRQRPRLARQSEPAEGRARGGDGPRLERHDALPERLALRAAGRLLFFFKDTAPTEIYALSLHAPLPI